MSYWPANKVSTILFSDGMKTWRVEYLKLLIVCQLQIGISIVDTDNIT